MTGQALTPYLLEYMARGTGGASLEANLTAVRGNCALAAEIAGAWHRLREMIPGPAASRRPVRLPSKETGTFTCRGRPVEEGWRKMAKRIILDCDPGHDDAIRILFAAGSPEIELVGITTVAGNQTLEKTTRNACAVATIAGLNEVPIVAGCDRPLLRPLRTAAEYHGDSGLDGPEPVTPAVPVTPGHAADFLIDSVMAAPGE